MVRDSALSSSNNELIRTIGNSLLGDKSLDELYKQSRTNQEKELLRIFTIISDNDVSSKERQELVSGAEKIKKTIDILEAKMATLTSSISEKEEKIQEQVDKIAEIIASVETESTKMENDQISWVKMCIEDSFYSYKCGNIGKDDIPDDILRRINNSNKKSRAMGKIELMLEDLGDHKSEVDSLTREAAGWITQKTALEKQYGAAQSSYNLIYKTLGQIGNANQQYTNSDYDTNIPVYSLEKTDIVANLFADASLNVASTNYDFTGKITSEEDLVNKYSQYFSPQNETPSGKDIYSSSNPAFGKLNNAINEGMLDDLKAANMNSTQIAQFLATNFAGAQFSYDGNTKFSIPYGHDTLSKNTTNKIRSFFTDINDYSYVKNTWDQNKGNTITSNAQIQALAANYETVIDKLAKGEPAFSFKEGIYALFGKDGLFKNSGISYDETKQGATPSYMIDVAGDSDTKDLYDKIATKIYNTWGVNPTYTNSYIDILEAENEEFSEPQPNIQSNNTDPITFKKDGIEYAFIIDRNQDNIFSSTSEFVGAKKNTSWLDDLKSLDTNKDGILNGEELADLKVLSSEYTDNAQTEYDENNNLRKTINNIEYKMKSAQGLGIEEINLQGLEQNVDLATGKKDINGSDLFNDGFKFKINGQEYNASRKDDNEYFMNAVYGNAEGKNFTIGLSEKEAKEQIELGYKKMDDFNSKFAKTFENIDVLNNFDTLNADVNAMYDRTVERINEEEGALRKEASNKAAALGELYSWDKIKSKVQSLAASQGLNIDMEQAEGIHTIDKSLNEYAIVQEWKKQNEEMKRLEKEKEGTTAAWDALIKCFKNGIVTNASEIRKLLSSGEADSADDVLRILKERKEEESEKEKEKEEEK